MHFFEFLLNFVHIITLGPNVASPGVGRERGSQVVWPVTSSRYQWIRGFKLKFVAHSRAT